MSDFLKINSNTKRYVFKNIANKAILKALIDGLKFDTITSVLKKKGLLIKQVIDQLVFD